MNGQQVRTRVANLYGGFDARELHAVEGADAFTVSDRILYKLLTDAEFYLTTLPREVPTTPTSPSNLSTVQSSILERITKLLRFGTGDIIGAEVHELAAAYAALEDSRR